MTIKFTPPPYESQSLTLDARRSHSFSLRHRPLAKAIFGALVVFGTGLSVANAATQISSPIETDTVLVDGFNVVAVVDGTNPVENQTLTVNEGVTVTGTSNSSLGISVTDSAVDFTDNAFVNSGTITGISRLSTIYSSSSGDLTNNTFTNNASGNISAAKLSVVFGNGVKTGTTLTNDGTMAFQGGAVISSFFDNTVTDSSDTTIDTTFNNTGSFSANLISVVSERGTITGTHVFNSGSLTATNSTSGSLSVVSSSSSSSSGTDIEDTLLQNTADGTITAKNVRAVDLMNMSGAITIDNTRVINEGTISGNVHGIEAWMGSSADVASQKTVSHTTVINAGTIDGALMPVSFNSTLSNLEVSDTTVVNLGTVGSSTAVRAPAKVISDTTLVLEGTLTGSGYHGVETTLQSMQDTSAEITNTTVYLGSTLSGHLYAASISGNGGSVTDVSIKDTKVYVYGDADLSEAILWGVDVDSATSTDKTLTCTGNELIIGMGPSTEITYDENGLTTSITPVVRAWNYHNIYNVRGFNRLTIRSADWENPITIFQMATISETGSTNTTLEVDVSNIAFSNASDLAIGDEKVILEIESLASKGLSLTTEESTYTVGTTLSGTATASLEKRNNAYYNDTVLYRIDTRNEVTRDDSEVESPVNGSSPSRNTDASPIITAQAQTHGVAMTSGAALMTVTQGANTASDAALALEHSGIIGTQVFGAMAGVASRQKTGSHIDMKSFLYTAGVGSNVRKGEGLLSGGIALEGGYGKFKNVFNAGDADPYIHKKGHVTTYGVTLTGAYEADNGWHVNGVLRGGRVLSRNQAGLYDASTGSTYDVNINSYYVTAEAGVGKRIAIDENKDLDFYAKYFYAYLGKDDFRAGSSDRYEVGGVTSHRARVGAKYEQKLNDKDAWYAGLAYEHEFDGKARVKVINGSIAADSKPADVDGGRAYAEFGFKSAPQNQLGWAYDAAIKGLYGSGLRSVRAELHLNYIF